MANKTFKHITEDQRQLATNLWNEFNKQLGNNGMALFYDYASGGLFVASSELAGVTGDNPGALDAESLESVIFEGGFGSDAVNNPPWFTNPGEYSLAVAEDA
jgi:hypothetical protein